MKNTNGRTDADVTDPNEIREIAQCYIPRKCGFKKVEAIARFGLRKSKGMNAYRIVLKYRAMIGTGPEVAQAAVVVRTVAAVEPVSAVHGEEHDEDEEALIAARNSAEQAPARCWVTFWRDAGLPEPKANIPAVAAPEFTEKQLADQAESRAALERLNSAKKKSLAPTKVSPEERAWGTGWRSGFYADKSACPYPGELARIWFIGRTAGEESRVAYQVLEGNLPDNALEAGSRPFPAEMAVAS